MKKSLKKIVASFLAALMVVFAMPFSALASDIDFSSLNYPVGVVNPYTDNGKRANYQLIFNAWTFNNKYFNYTQSAVSLNNRGIKDLPLEYDQTNHQLWARKATADTAGFTKDSGARAANQRYTYSGDHQLQAGDYFTMTITLENVKYLYAGSIGLEWHGVEGVPIYKTSYTDPDSGNPVVNYTFLSKDENTALQNTAEELGLDYDSEVTYETNTEAYKPIGDLSAGNSTYFSQFTDFTIGGSTYWEGDKHFVFGAGTMADAGYEDVSHITNKVKGVNSFKNPVTGAQNYDFDYQAPLGTYIFKVTDPNDIGFTIHRQADAGGHVDEVCDVYVTEDTTQAKNAYNYGRSWDVGLTGSTGEVATDHSFAVGFMGTNVYADAQTSKSKVTFNNEDGTAISTLEGDSGSAYEIPSLDNYKKDPDPTGHYTAAWKDADGNAPSGTFGDADQTFTLTYDRADHTYTSAVTKEATDTEAGATTYTCSECGYSYVDNTTPAAKGHTYADPTFTWSDVVATNDTQSAKATATRACVNGDDTQTAEATVTAGDVTPATEAAAGSVTFTATATFDGKEYTATKTEAIPQLAHTHVYGEPTFDWSDIVATNDTQSAKATASRACTAGDDTQTAEATVTAGDVTPATEDAAGSVTFTATATFADGTVATDTKTVEIAKLAHTHKYGEVTFAWDGTTAATASRSCTAGDDTQTAEAVITSETTPATCTEAGKTVYTATATFADGTVAKDTKSEDIAPLGHEYGEAKINWAADNTATATRSCVRGDDTQTVNAVVTSETTAATKKEAGKTVYTATATFADGTVATDTKTDVIPALGVNVTVAKTDLGTVSGDIETNGSEVTKTFAYGKTYTVTASNSDKTFLGWEINGKLVSQTETYTGIAYTDVTLVPVYKPASEGINVYFYDKYGNVFKSFEGVTAADYQAAVAAGVPEAPQYPGYVFKGYDVADDAIKANDTNAAYVAQYAKAETTYTVSAPGATVIADAGTVSGDTATVPYDTKVTVKAEGAEGWKIGDKVVAYGDTYSFYVGSDVVVEPVTGVTAQTSVNIINVTPNAPYYTFLATRTSGNATIKERGWIYGKNLDDSALADIETAKASGARVKMANVTASEQFSLTLKSTSGTVKARAFIVDSQGNIYYSDIQSVEA